MFKKKKKKSYLKKKNTKQHLSNKLPKSLPIIAFLVELFNENIKKLLSAALPL